jgi:hypothetical protein
MYEALSGSVPIAGNTAFETLLKHMSERPIPIKELMSKENISEALQTVVMKSLEKEPAKRFQSMAEVTAALAELPESQGKRAGFLGLSGINYGITRKTKIIIGAAVSVLCLGAGLVVFMPEARNNKSVESSEVELAKRTAKLAHSEPDYSMSSGASGNINGNRPKWQSQVVWRMLTEEQVEANIKQQPDATNLCLSDCRITDEGAEKLSRLKLMRLEILQCGQLTTQGYLTIIEKQPYLQWLRITHSSQTGSFMAAINNLHELRSLSLNDVPKIEGTALSGLPRTLEDLSLAGDKQIPTYCFPDLARLTSLSSLDLMGTVVSDSSICKLSGLKKLKVLRLNECPITDDSIKCILKLRNLETLSLKKTSISADGFFKLAVLPHLQDLDIGGTSVSSDDATKFLETRHMGICIIRPYVNGSEVLQRGSLTRDLNLPGKEKF